MTLQQFLALTGPVDRPALRAAMAEALAVESPDGHDAYHRFYCRVLRRLDLAPDPGCRTRDTFAAA